MALGRYFYQVIIKNAPRHKLLEEKPKSFPSDNLIFNMVSTQTFWSPYTYFKSKLEGKGKIF